MEGGGRSRKVSIGDYHQPTSVSLFQLFMRGGYYQPKQQFGVVKTNENSGGVLEALRREHQGGTAGTGGTESPPASTSLP